MPIEAGVVAKVIVVCDGKILLLTRSSADTNRPSGFDLPGGGVDPGETITQAVIREAHEEAGWLINPNELSELHVPSLVSNTPGVEKHVFIAHIAGQPIVLSEEHDAYSWYEPAVALKLFPHPFYGPAIAYVISEKLL